MPMKLTRAQATAIREAIRTVYGIDVAVRLTLNSDGSVEIIRSSRSA